MNPTIDIKGKRAVRFQTTHRENFDVSHDGKGFKTIMPAVAVDVTHDFAVVLGTGTFHAIIYTAAASDYAESLPPSSASSKPSSS